MVSKFPHDSGIEFMLGNLDPSVKRLGSIIREHGDAALAENRSCIDACIDQVNSTTGLRNTGFYSLTPCLQSTERRQKRRVNIQNAAGKGIQKWFFDDTHVSRKNDEIDLGITQQTDDFTFGFRGHLGPVRTWSNKVTGNFKCPREIQNAGMLHIGEDDDRLSVQDSGLKGLRKGSKIGSLARTKNTESYHRKIRRIW